MNDNTIDNEITGGAVDVTIAGKLCRLSFPMAAVIRYKQKSGDSLFQELAWKRIDLEQDPERWTALLWSGMHEEQEDGSWKSPFTLAELEKALNFSNTIAIRPYLLKALTLWLPKVEPDPNAQAAPETGTPAADAEKNPTLPTSSLDSGFAAAAD